MKFAKQLEEYQLPEWKGQYIPYQRLKKQLYVIKEEYGDKAHVVPLPGSPQPAPQGLGSKRESSWANLKKAAAGVWEPLPDSGSPKHPKNPWAKRLFGTSDPEEAWQNPSSKQPLLSPSAAWRAELKEEAERVKACVDYGFDGLRAQLEDVIEMMPDDDKNDEEKEMTKEEKFQEIRIMEALCRVSEGLVRLRGFAELNHAAMYKILKKHDKTLKSTVGLQETLPELLKSTGLGDVARFDLMDTEIKKAFGFLGKDQDCSPEVARLAAGLGTMGKAHMLNTQDAAMHWHEQVLCFFLGASVMSMFFLGVFIFLPPQEKHTFSTAYFLVNFCTFRVPLSAMLLVWGMGFVARVCEKSNINHKFLLGVDPRCHIQDKFLFGIAAAFTVLWVFIYGLYVIDYKWMIFQQEEAHASERETPDAFNTRASWHYVLYPVGVIVSIICMMLTPSRVCRSRFKVGLLRSVGRVCLAPFFTVSFGDNITGDVMTSLAKPLQDIPPTICYLFKPHPQTRADIVTFVATGDTCPDWIEEWAVPILAGAPFWFRLLQCARRYYDTREMRNLLNLGKYTSSLLVVIVSAVTKKSNPLAIVIVSVVCTVYNAIWDVFFDWGLGYEELSLFARETKVQIDDMVHSRTLAITQFRDPEDFIRRLTPVTEEPDPEGAPEEDGMQTKRPQYRNTRQRSERKQEKMKRHFSPGHYLAASFFDIVARCSWVLTLLPISILSDSIVQRALLLVFTSATEIARRSIWAVLRMENEQIANASGYRALLWVPTKLNEDGMLSAMHAEDTMRQEGRMSRRNLVKSETFEQVDSDKSSDEEKGKKDKKDKKDKKNKKEKVEFDLQASDEGKDVCVVQTPANLELEGLASAKEPLLGGIGDGC